jgi:hypothetical protein
MLYRREKTLLAVAAVAAASTLSLCTVPAHAQDTPIKRHITVRSTDTRAGASVGHYTFHASEGRLVGVHPQVAKVNQAGAAETGAVADALAGAHAMSGAPEATPMHMDEHGQGQGHINYFPADLSLSTSQGSFLPSSTHHALYVNYTGSIADNFGNPEGFLADLNDSSFIHVTDQYVGSHANHRYPVGGNANVTVPVSGNILQLSDVFSILHAAAQVYGSGGTNMFDVFLPKGLDTCLDAANTVCYSPDNSATWVFCAWHGAVLFGDVGVVVYTMQPYQNVPGCQEAPPNPNGAVADSTNGTLVHEVFETITDPLGDGWINTKSDVLQGNEIGDECELVTNGFEQMTDPTFKINGHFYQAQLEYSNHSHNCTSVP